MAIFFDAPVSPDDLTVFVRQVPTPRQNIWYDLFPREYIDDNTVDWAEILHTNRTARFRSFDGRIHVSERDAGSSSKVSLIPLSSSLNKGELERLQLQFARTGGTLTGALARAAYNDAQNLTEEVINRLEQAWGDVLTDGKLTVNEEGFQGEADYGVPGTHVIAPGTAWTTLSAPALDNLMSAADVYVATNGDLPGQWRTSQRVMRLMQQNTQLVGAIAGTTSGRTRVTMAEINGLLAENSLPAFSLRPGDNRVDVDGTSTRITPDDRIFAMPADENLGELGATVMGVSATALELVNSNESELSFEEAPGIVGLIEKIGPPYREFTFVDAVGMPVLRNAKKLMILDVA